MEKVRVTRHYYVFFSCLIQYRPILGVFKFANGDVYEGNFRCNKSEGHGVYRSFYGDVYEGEYKADKRHGKGVVRTAMGTTFRGKWEKGVKVGPSMCVAS
jgi:hypothetical protein